MLGGIREISNKDGVIDNFFERDKLNRVRSTEVDTNPIIHLPKMTCINPFGLDQ